MLRTPQSKKSQVIPQLPVRVKVTEPQKEYKRARRLDFSSFVLHADGNSDKSVPQ